MTGVMSELRGTLEFTESRRPLDCFKECGLFLRSGNWSRHPDARETEAEGLLPILDQPEMHSKTSSHKGNWAWQDSSVGEGPGTRTAKANTASTRILWYMYMHAQDKSQEKLRPELQTVWQTALYLGPRMA